MTGYEVQIAYSSKELSARDRIAVKDTTNAVALDEATNGHEVIITPDYFVELSVHNEKSEDKDYKKFVIVDKDGTKYVTGSESFYTSFKAIADEMGEEDYQVVAYKIDSKNYKGKQFITCSIN